MKFDAGFLLTSRELPHIDTAVALAGKKKSGLFLVGGFLRDQFLSRKGRDLDFIVVSGAVAFARVFARQVRGSFILLDDAAGCARVAKRMPDGLWTFDFTDLRDTTLAGDIAKRDFTVNTLVTDLMVLKPGVKIAEACLKNPRAMADLKAKTIRMTGVAAFDDDPLRLLRAYSLSAQTGFKIDAKTIAAIRPRVRSIRNVSPERVREELFKIFASPRAAATVRAMERSGLLFAVIPQLKLMASVPPGGYHHLNVWKHSVLVLAEFEKIVRLLKDQEVRSYLDEAVGGGHSRLALVKFACLLHDVGKPETRREMPDGRLAFHGHERAGRDITRIICRQLKVSTAERYALEDMVALHLRPGYLSNFKSAPARMVFRFMRDARAEAVSTLLLSLADQRATRGPLTTDAMVAHHADIVLPLVRSFFEVRRQKPFVRLIDGNDLIRELKLKPGPEFKAILAAVDEAQHLGKVTTREQALDLVRQGMAK
jgi:poly(A) polymerase